jgi:hypothetical protein
VVSVVLIAVACILIFKYINKYKIRLKKCVASTGGCNLEEF